MARILLAPVGSTGGHGQILRAAAVYTRSVQARAPVRGGADTRRPRPGGARPWLTGTAAGRDLISPPAGSRPGSSRWVHRPPTTASARAHRLTPRPRPPHPKRL